MAKIGDFAIARFDDVELPCLITGRDVSNPNEQTFVYWDEDLPGKFIVNRDSLHKSRFESLGFNVGSKMFPRAKYLEQIR